MTAICLARRVRPILVLGGLALLLAISAAIAESPYATPTRDGRERLMRAGTCPTGYVGKGNKCEAMHQDTPRAYPRVEGTRCPTGTFQSGDYCKAFR
ncbi:hypothetical protein [Tardiphaga sp. 862_B3_N1_1]|uniref:hypothetical protein n=1 Tax=Tardiphaga sp. 862_B3_N1_1 TaxID=3240763 RepID=UPI003F8B7534